MLALLDYYSPMNFDAFVEPVWIFRLFPSCHEGVSLSVWIQSYIITDYFCTSQKASVGKILKIKWEY